MDVGPEAFARHIGAVREKSTARRYREAVRGFLRYCQKRQVDLHRAQPGLLSQYAAELARTGMSASTVHVHVTGTKRYLDWRRSLGDPVSMLARPDLPKVIVPIPDALNVQQLQAYLNACNELAEPVRSALLILPYSGLRCSELVRLRLDSVRTATTRSRLQVHFQLSGKGRKERAVPVLEECYDALRAYVSGWRTRQRKSPWLFPDGAGNPLKQREVGRQVEQVRARAGLRKLTPHTLRRTYATNLYLMGVDPTTIAFVLGHDSVTTTKKHYLAAGAPALWNAIDLARARRADA